MLNRHCLAALVVALSLGATAPAPSHRLELKDGWYHIDGRKFLVNAIGYEPSARPGEDPYGKRVSNPVQIRKDLQIIKGAGFNGIRTWSEMPEAELKLVQESGLKIIYGIWLKPEENFADPAVVEKDLALIRRTLAYTHKYDCVITYLIMNEPMPEHLHQVGAQATRDLWTKAKELIHQLHPGVPVTISGNSAITEWVDMNLFDVYSRNAYDYKDGVNYTHGFANAMRFLGETFKQGKPAIVTEFGRSVSRQGGAYYGANTLQEQADALTKYYRDILDSGATGLCPFYFADGWWKGGKPEVHDDTAEEWFGFLGFKNLKDQIGTPRPVWHALKQYNQALVVSPKNQQFYLNDVPIEIFFQPAVKKFRVVYQDGVLLEATPSKGTYAGHLRFPGESLKDRELVFESYDGQGRLLKLESLVVLTGKDPIEWPSLELHTSVTDLEGTKEVPIELTLKNAGPFSLGDQVRMACSPHKGWNRAEARALKLDPAKQEQTLSSTFQVPGDSVMTALYAGTDVRFGKFVKTIYAQQYLYRGAWAEAIRVK